MKKNPSSSQHKPPSCRTLRKLQLLTAPPSGWHVRGVAAAVVNSQPGTGAPASGTSRRRRVPSNHPSPPFQHSITDRRKQKHLAREQHVTQPSAPPSLLSDAAVLAAVNACATHEQLATLAQALASPPMNSKISVTTIQAPLPQDSMHGQQAGREQPVPQRPQQQRQDGHSHVTRTQALQALQPQHAILLLSRLAQLHPSHTVMASVMMQRLPASPLTAVNLQTPSPTPSATPPTATQPTAAAAPAPLPSISTSAEPSAAGVGEYLPQAPDSTGAQGPGTYQQWGVGVLSTEQASKPSPLNKPPVRPTPAADTNLSAETSSLLARPNPRATPSTAESSRHVAATGGDDDSDAEGVAASRAESERAAVGQLSDELVRSVVQGGLERLTPVDLSELLSAMAKLGYPRTVVVAEVCEYVRLSGAMVHMRATPHALVNTAWAVAKLGRDPGPEWIAHFLHVSSGVVPSFSAVDCAACCWTLARWGFRPAVPWLALMYGRLRQVAPQLGPQGVVNVGWGLAMLKALVPRDIAEMLMIEAQVLLPNMTAMGLATLCWALATLQHRPPGFWVEEALGCMVTKMPSIPKSARGLPFANLVWALSVWQTAQPTNAWLTTFCREAARSLPVMSGRSIAVLMLGLADLAHTPDTVWVSLALEEFHKRGVAEASPQSLVAVLWSVSRLLRPAEAQGGSGASTWKPERKWLIRYAHILQDIADSVAARFPSLSPPDLVDVLVALADTRYHPGQRWLDIHTAYCNVCINEFSAYQIKLMNNAMSILSELREADYLPKKGEMV